MRRPPPNRRLQVGGGMKSTLPGKFDKKKLRRQYADGDLAVETLA